MLASALLIGLCGLQLALEATDLRVEVRRPGFRLEELLAPNEIAGRLALCTSRRCGGNGLGLLELDLPQAFCAGRKCFSACRLFFTGEFEFALRGADTTSQQTT